MSDVTRILSQLEAGDPSAVEQLLPLVYEELRKPAAAKLAQEKPGQTLQATALVHDAYIRLVDVEKARHWDSRGHCFIGSNLARALVDLGADVLLVDSLIPDYRGNLFNVAGIEDRVRVNVADVRQQSTMNYLVRDRDVIFSLAGQVSPGSGQPVIDIHSQFHLQSTFPGVGMLCKNIQNQCSPIQNPDFIAHNFLKLSQMPGRKFVIEQ